MRIPLLLLTTLTTGLAAQNPTIPPVPAEKQVIQLPGSWPGLPFSSAVRVGNVLYLSGAIGVLPGTRQLVDTGVVKQTQQTLDNIKAVLLYAGSSMERVFKCTVFLTNIRDFDQMNSVYTTYFPKDPPARSTVAGSGLALGARVEIECLATAG
jgi:reactive intermediate/imine deaminase